MQTVVIGSQKGGSAKTTLAAHLAVEAERRGDEPAWLIDTAPAASADNDAISQLVDLVLIPVRPSPADLWAVGATVAAVRESGRRLLFVITQAKPGSIITAQSTAALSRHGPVAQAMIADWVGYAMAMTSVSTAPELAPKGPAALELAALWAGGKAFFVESSKLERTGSHG